jgi:hypothetical protein
MVRAARLVYRTQVPAMHSWCLRAKAAQAIMGKADVCVWRTAMPAMPITVAVGVARLVMGSQVAFAFPTS